MSEPPTSFRSSLLPMVVADDERHYVAANRAACLRLRVDDLTPPESREDMDEMWATFLSEGTQRGAFELRMPANRARPSTTYSATAHVEAGRHLSILMFPPSAGDVEHETGRSVSTELLTDREREVPMRATERTRSPWV